MDGLRYFQKSRKIVKYMLQNIQINKYRNSKKRTKERDTYTSFSQENISRPKDFKKKYYICIAKTYPYI